MLRPRERRRPVMPNQLSPIVEQRIVAFALGHPGLGRGASPRSSRARSGAGCSSVPTASGRCCAATGSTRAPSGWRWSPATARPTSRRASPSRSRTSSASRPGELVGIDCFFVGRLHGTKGTVWQITAIDTYSSLRLGRAGRPPQRWPERRAHLPLARRVAAELQAAGWRLERVLSDNGNEFRSRRFSDTLAALGVRHTRIRAGRPQTNGHVERLHRTILEECWRPAFARFLQVRFTGLRRELARYLDYYNHNAPTPAASPPDAARPSSSTVRARWSRDEPQPVGTTRSLFSLGRSALRLPEARSRRRPAWRRRCASRPGPRAARAAPSRRARAPAPWRRRCPAPRRRAATAAAGVALDDAAAEPAAQLEGEVRAARRRRPAPRASRRARRRSARRARRSPVCSSRWTTGLEAVSCSPLRPGARAKLIGPMSSRAARV